MFGLQLHLLLGPLHCHGNDLCFQECNISRGNWINDPGGQGVGGRGQGVKFPLVKGSYILAITSPYLVPLHGDHCPGRALGHDEVLQSLNGHPMSQDPPHRGEPRVIPGGVVISHGGLDSGGPTYHPETIPWSTIQRSFLFERTVFCRLSRLYS